MLHSGDRRDVTALAAHINKCTEVNWTVNFNITGNRKMMKNMLHSFKFSDFFTSLRLIRRKNIVFCPTTINLIVISPIIHKLLKNLDVGGVNGKWFAIIQGFLTLTIFFTMMAYIFLVIIIYVLLPYVCIYVI